MSIFTFLLFCLYINVNGETTYLWETWGGTLKNQQSTPNTTSVFIDKTNIKDVSELCQYKQIFGYASYGFTTVYRSNNSLYGIITDFSGHITNINLDTCNLLWKTHIGSALGSPNMIYVTRNGVSLFKDSLGREGVIFGTPNIPSPTVPSNATLYVVALNLHNGTLMFKIPMSGKSTFASENNAYIHAVSVKDDYAYAGMSSACNNHDFFTDCKFIGRMFKIDIINQNITDIWFSIDESKQPNLIDNPDQPFYQGASIWNWPAIIDNYLLFGTGIHNIFIICTDIYVHKLIYLRVFIQETYIRHRTTLWIV